MIILLYCYVVGLLHYYTRLLLLHCQLTHYDIGAFSRYYVIIVLHYNHTITLGQYRITCRRCTLPAFFEAGGMPPLTAAGLFWSGRHTPAARCRPRSRSKWCRRLAWLLRPQVRRGRAPRGAGGGSGFACSHVGVSFLLVAAFLPRFHHLHCMAVTFSNIS